MSIPVYERQTMTLSEFPPAESLQHHLINSWNSYLRCYRMGNCSVIVTREHDRFHLSISRLDRIPSWPEIAEAWYRCVPQAQQRTGCIALPPSANYINIHPFCMQVVEIDGVAEGIASQPLPQDLR